MDKVRKTKTDRLKRMDYIKVMQNEFEFIVSEEHSKQTCSGLQRTKERL